MISVQLCAALFEIWLVLIVLYVNQHLQLYFIWWRGENIWRGQNECVACYQCATADSWYVEEDVYSVNETMKGGFGRISFFRVLFWIWNSQLSRSFCLVAFVCCSVVFIVPFLVTVPSHQPATLAPYALILNWITVMLNLVRFRVVVFDLIVRLSAVAPIYLLHVPPIPGSVVIVPLHLVIMDRCRRLGELAYFLLTADEEPSKQRRMVDEIDDN